MSEAVKISLRGCFSMIFPTPTKFFVALFGMPPRYVIVMRAAEMPCKPTAPPPNCNLTLNPCTITGARVCACLSNAPSQAYDRVPV